MVSFYEKSVDRYFTCLVFFLGWNMKQAPHLTNEQSSSNNAFFSIMVYVKQVQEEIIFPQITQKT